MLDALAGGGARFFRAIGGTMPDAEVAAAIWDLVWAGRLTNDTLAPLRVTVGAPGSRRAPAPRRPAIGRPKLGGQRRPAMPSRTGPPTVSGRWSLLASEPVEVTVAAHARALALLERHGVVTRGAVAAERIPGGFGGVYPVLRAMEETGQCRRGYFVEGLGGAQFALAGAVDRMRGLVSSPESVRRVVLPAADPAQPYGAALPWPPSEVTHRPGRKAGAIVVMIDGELVLYVERGGRTLLSWSDEMAVLEPAAAALAQAVRNGALGRVTVEKADGEGVLNSPLAAALEAAGFRATPRGLRLRG